MNILQVLPELNVGGVETGTVDFAKYLVQHEHKSVVVSHGGALVCDLEKSGSHHYTLAVHKKSLWTIWKMVGFLRKIIQDERIDIVHARSRVPAWIAYFACRKTKAKFITTCHGYYKSRIFSQVMGWPKLVIVPSEVIGRHMIDDFNVLRESIRCIPRGVDLKRFKVQKKEKDEQSNFTIAIVGRMTPLKGHSYFIRSMAKVVRTFPYAKIWIIGDAPANKEFYRKDIELLVNRLGLKNNVEFLGSRPDVPDLLAKTDVLVFSSIVPESFGRAILEAQAVGVPVVATSVGGVVDIIDDEQTGLLVPSKDIDAMAQKILRILKDPQLGHRLAAEAKKKLKDKFTVEQMAAKILEVYDELLQSTNILVIKISSLGDVVLVTASLKAIRQKFSHAKICCLVGKESLKILQNCPYIDEIIVYDAKHKDRGWIGLFKLSGRLRKCKFDTIIDFQNNRRSHVLSFLSFARESYGYNNKKWGRLLSHPVEDTRKGLPAVVHQFQLLESLGIRYKENTYLELWLSKKDRGSARNLLNTEWLGNSVNIVGINISASANWPTKNWPIEYTARLCDLLAGKNIRVLITGMAKDERLAQTLSSLTKSKPAFFIGKTDVLELAALIEKCKVYITPDSAPMHLAAAVETPIIAFFGPTDSTRHIPPAKKIIVLEKKLTCAPCYSTRCRILTHACMKDITPEEVFNEVEALIEAKK